MGEVEISRLLYATVWINLNRHHAGKRMGLSALGGIPADAIEHHADESMTPSHVSMRAT